VSPKLPRVTAADALRALSRDDWYVARRSASSHQILRHPVKPGRTTIAMHAGEIVKAKTLAQILKDTGLTADEFIALLRG
jgi:predicted RNA binding protein YcfA (HicA-like mRNA interferase family)